MVGGIYQRLEHLLAVYLSLPRQIKEKGLGQKQLAKYALTYDSHSILIEVTRPFYFVFIKCIHKQIFDCSFNITEYICLASPFVNSRDMKFFVLFRDLTYFRIITPFMRKKNIDKKE